MVKSLSFLCEYHFHISPFHSLFITCLQLPCKRRLNCHLFLSANSLVNIKPYLLLINPRLKHPPSVINYSHTEKLGGYGHLLFDAREACIIKTTGFSQQQCVCLICLSICVRRRTSYISIAASFLVALSSKWVLSLLSHYGQGKPPPLLFYCSPKPFPPVAHCWFATHSVKTESQIQQRKGTLTNF